MHRPARFASLTHARLSAIVLLAIGVAIAVAGCASKDSTATVSGDRSAQAAAAASAEIARREAELDRKYVIGPTTARQLGYRIDWQYPAGGTAIKRFAIQGDSVFALDQRNFLSRFRQEQGNRIWRIPVAGPNDDILGITYVPETDCVYLTTGGAIMVFESATGSQVDKQKLERIANTEPIIFGQFLIYGSRRGQLIWHSYRLDSDWRGYQIAKTMRLPPIYEDRYIIAVGNDGEVMCLLARSASQVWRKKALDSIEALPAAGNGAVYVPSRDQHLRAYELAENRSPLWEYLTESPLTDSPTLIGDRVYQQVASEGLVCLEALPLDSPGGKVIWTANEASGSVLTQMQDNLITWDAAGKMLQTVDARLGAVIDSLHMPQIQSIIATSVVKGDIYATGVDGRIIRLVPRN